MIVYGTSPTPGAPGTWDRETWRALYYGARARRAWPELKPVTYGAITIKGTI